MNFKENILSEVYKKSLAENERNICFWEQHLQKLEALDFNIYSEKLKVPILVPIGSRVLFRGALQHTNEVTVALGADYFTKCSITQAEVLRQHRIADAKSKLKEYNKEKKYLESQLFSKENVYSDLGHDILETCSEEEDKAWRKQHRERVKKYNQSKDKKQEAVAEEGTVDELWYKLEQLELKEELGNELKSTETQEDDTVSDDNSFNSFIIEEDDVSITETEEKSKEAHIVRAVPKQTSKIDLMQQVIDRQKILESKLSEMINRTRAQTKTEEDLLSRLDELFQLEEVEEEMDRLEGMIEGSSDDEVEMKPIEDAHNTKKRITFADKDSETLEITFKHSDVQPTEELYQPYKGITKPSDIYQVYPKLFTKETTSILRKSKYEIDPNVENNNFISEEPQPSSPMEKPERKTIEINNVKEISDQNQIKVDSASRPMSLFKKKRLQKKS